MNLSGNNLQDQGIAVFSNPAEGTSAHPLQAVGAAVGALSHGLIQLNVSKVNATKSGMASLCNNLKKNMYVQPQDRS